MRWASNPPRKNKMLSFWSNGVPGKVQAASEKSSIDSADDSIIHKNTRETRGIRIINQEILHGPKSMYCKM